MIDAVWLLRFRVWESSANFHWPVLIKTRECLRRGHTGFAYSSKETCSASAINRMEWTWKLTSLNILSTNQLNAQKRRSNIFVCDQARDTTCEKTLFGVFTEYTNSTGISDLERIKLTKWNNLWCYAFMATDEFQDTFAATAGPWNTEVERGPYNPSIARGSS